MKQKRSVEYISVEYCADIYSYNIWGTAVPYSCTTVTSYVSRACKIVTNWKSGSPHTTSCRRFPCRRPRLCSWSAATGAFCWWSRFRWVLATAFRLRNIFVQNTLSKTRSESVQSNVSYTRITYIYTDSVPKRTLFVNWPSFGYRPIGSIDLNIFVIYSGLL